MKTHRLVSAEQTILDGSARQSAHAQLLGIGRTNLIKLDLTTPSREFVYVRFDLLLGVVSAKHSHLDEGPI